MAMYEIDAEHDSSGHVLFHVLRFSDGGREVVCHCDTRQQAERAVLAFNALDYLEKEPWTTWQPFP